MLLRYLGFALVCVVLAASPVRAIAATPVTKITLFPNQQAWVQQQRPLVSAPMAGAVPSGQRTPDAVWVSPASQGGQRLTLPDLPAELQPNTLWLAPANPADAWRISQHQWLWQPLNLPYYLERMQGQTITYHDQLASSDDDKLIRQATLVAFMPQSDLAVVRPLSCLPATACGKAASPSVDKNGTNVIPAHWVVLDRLPQGFAPHPVWQVELANTVKANSNAVVGYGIPNWDARVSYTAWWHPESQQLVLQGWLNTTNPTSQSYNNALLSLVVGEPATQQQEAYPNYRRGKLMAAPMMAMATADEAGSLNAEAKAVGDVFWLTLPKPVTLPAKQPLTLTWLEPTSIPAKLTYTYDTGYWWQHANDTDESHDYRHPQQQVSVALRFKNQADTQANAAEASKQALGQALPAGSFKVFSADPASQGELLGDTHLGLLPAGEEATLPMGQAFNVLASKTQNTYQQAKTRERSVFTYTLTNRKPHPVTVHFKEHPPENMSVISVWPDQAPAKLGTGWQQRTGLVEGQITVPAGETVTWQLTYVAKLPK